MAGGGVHLSVPHLSSSRPDVAPAVQPRRTKPSVIVAKVLLINPVAIGRLRATIALGAKLEVSFDGYGLVVKAVLP